MDRNLAAAVGRLRAGGALGGAQAAFLERVARGELVSVRLELQLALWAGVTLIAAAAGIFVKERLSALGPLAVTLAVGGGAALSLLYVARRAPRYSNGEVPSPTLAFDYVLLLGVLLLGSELACLEAWFKVLGPNWSWHLLLLAVVQLALAYRYDARGVLSLALASFAAWRGVALSVAGGALAGSAGEPIRANALVLGALFFGVGRATGRRGLKPHFEPVWGNLGLVLLLGAPLAGVFDAHGASLAVWAALLALLAPAAAFSGFRDGRTDYFACGVVAAYLGLLRGLFELHFMRSSTGFFLVAASSLAVIALLARARAAMRERR